MTLAPQWLGPQRAVPGRCVLLHYRSGLYVAIIRHNTGGGGAQRHQNIAVGKPCDVQANLMGSFSKGALNSSLLAAASSSVAHMHTNLLPHGLSQLTGTSQNFSWNTPDFSPLLVYLPPLHEDMHSLPCTSLLSRATPASKVSYRCLPFAVPLHFSIF